MTARKPTRALIPIAIVAGLIIWQGPALAGPLQDQQKGDQGKAPGSQSTGGPNTVTTLKKENVGPAADTIQQYRPVGRDPFKKLVIRSTKPKKPVAIGFPPLEVRRSQFQQRAQRAADEGKPDPDPMGQYLVSELDVLGVFSDEHGLGAFVRAGPTGTTFYARRAARCFNGEILRIEVEGMESSGSRVIFREKAFIEAGGKQVEQERVVAKAATAKAAR